MKRYRLLKDISSPAGCVKAGCVGIDDGYGRIWFETQYWREETCEANKEWFEPIPDTPEQTTKEGFVWTDELVKEYASKWIEAASANENYISVESFKASKQSQSNTPEQKPYPVDEVRQVITYKYNKDFGDDKLCKCGHPYYRHFDTYENMAAVGCKYCGCFEFELAEPSNTPKEEQPSKEWEVMEFKNKAGLVLKRFNVDCFEYGGTENYHIKRGDTIHSVRRISDGEVFSVGDIICWGNGEKFETELQGFRVTQKGDLKFRWSDDIWQNFITEVYNLHKKLPSNKPSEVCGINREWVIKSHPTDISKVMKAQDCRYIGTRSECEEFVATRKPSEQPIKEDRTHVTIDENAFKDCCGVCGSKLVEIRGEYPSDEKRKVCATCNTERLEQINKISHRDYGKTYQSIIN